MDSPIPHPSQIWLEWYCLLSRWACLPLQPSFMTLNSLATIFPSTQKILLITHSSEWEPSLFAPCYGQPCQLDVYGVTEIQVLKCPESRGLINIGEFTVLSWPARSVNHSPRETPVPYLWPTNSIQQCTELFTCTQHFSHLTLKANWFINSDGFVENVTFFLPLCHMRY